MLTLVQIPQHGSAVLASGSAQGTIRRAAHSVQVTSVAKQVGQQLQVGQGPNLDNLIPTTGHDQRGSGVGVEADAGNPVGVPILADGVLALTKSVPDLGEKNGGSAE